MCRDTSDRRPRTQAAERCLRRYGDAHRLLDVFNPSHQLEYTRDVTRALTGDAPSLGTLKVAYGPDMAKAWLVPQIVDLNLYAGCREKMNSFQLDSLAGTIAHNWGYMKLTELMLFFQKLKAGEFGRFYGTVDGMVITDALQEFARWRRSRLLEIEREREMELRAEQEKTMRAVNAAFRTLWHDTAHMSGPLEFVRFLQGKGLEDDPCAGAQLAWLLALLRAWGFGEDRTD